MTNALPPSVLIASQRCVYGLRLFTENGQTFRITAKVCFDDQCRNGRNSFSITGTIERKAGSRWVDDAGGCIHEEIAKHFPELAPFLKWHLCSSDGPMHYIENTCFLAGDKDHWGLSKGEFRQHTSRGKIQAGGVEGVPAWTLQRKETDPSFHQTVYSHEKPAPVTFEWVPYGTTGEGKERELDAARRVAIWPEATDEQLSLPRAELRALLEARLPALMVEFRAAVESLGFTY